MLLSVSGLCWCGRPGLHNTRELLPDICNIFFLQPSTTPHANTSHAMLQMTASQPSYITEPCFQFDSLKIAVIPPPTAPLKRFSSFSNSPEIYRKSFPCLIFLLLSHDFIWFSKTSMYMSKYKIIKLWEWNMAYLHINELDHSISDVTTKHFKFTLLDGSRGLHISLSTVIISYTFR
jgi:hypothetical protein